MRLKAERNIGFSATVSARALNVEGKSLAIFIPPIRYEAPAHGNKLWTRISHSHDIDSRCRSDIVAGAQVARRLGQPIKLDQFAPTEELGEASAHCAKSISLGNRSLIIHRDSLQDCPTGGRPIPRIKSSPKKGLAVRLQYGALPYHFTDAGALEILLVTTRKTKRWMIPKGWPIKGLKAAKSAAREAYEEAGVRGTIRARSIGFFTYDKRLEEDGITVPCEVKVFPLLVKRQDLTWPESRQRKCEWFAPELAVSAIKEESLRELISSFLENLDASASAKLPRRVREPASGDR